MSLNYFYNFLIFIRPAYLNLTIQHLQHFCLYFLQWTPSSYQFQVQSKICYWLISFNIFKWHQVFQKIIIIFLSFHWCLRFWNINLFFSSTILNWQWCLSKEISKYQMKPLRKMYFHFSICNHCSIFIKLIPTHLYRYQISQFCFCLF